MRNCRISVCVAMLLLLCLNINMAAASEMIYAGKDKSSNAQKIRDALVVDQHLYFVEEKRIAEYSFSSMQPNIEGDGLKTDCLPHYEVEPLFQYGKNDSKVIRKKHDAVTFFTVNKSSWKN